MRQLDVPVPIIDTVTSHDRLALKVMLPEDALPWDRSGPVGLSAVIEEADGTISYWAVAHPDGKADFHHRDCFALMLPPVDRA
jgi:hypothetical protein